MTLQLTRTCSAVVVAISLAAASAGADAQPTGNPALDCPPLAVSAEREPEWYASLCADYLPKQQLLPPAKEGAVPATLGDPAYQLDLRAVTNTLETFALPDAASPTVSPTTALDSYAMEHDNSTGVLFAIQNATQTLGTVDKVTGAFTAGQVLTGLPAGDPSGLAFVDSSSTFYVSFFAPDSTIHAIDPGTGIATLVGSTGVPSIIDIAIDADGNLYGHSIDTDSIYSIDTTTGAAALIGPTGVDANFAQSIDFDKSTGVLYAWLYVGGGVNQFASIDLATGAATTAATPTNKEYEGALTPVSLQAFSVE